MDVAMFEWLLTGPGQTLLLEATHADGSDPLRAAASLRSAGTPDQVSAALTQAELRRHAVAKFGGFADRMYFTRDGLEQATRLPVALHRAGRMKAAEPGSVADLGCGIGGDLIALADAGLTTAGVEQDPLRVAIARANLAALDLGGAVAQADATAIDLSHFGAVFADPARRSGAGRSFAPDTWLPGWDFVERLLGRSACVKVAPGVPHAIVPDGVEAEWVSDHGEVKEAALWSGGLASTRRRATVIGDGGLATLTGEDDPYADAEPPVRPPGRYLYEPDGAVIRAGLVTAVADLVHGGLLDEHIAYVTSDEQVPTPFARGYQVIEELPYREKALKSALRARGIGQLTIKKRGVQVVPEQLRTRLAPIGDAEATIVLTRVAGRGTVFLVRPLRGTTARREPTR